MTERDPFKIEGPALISVSGGRTSGLSVVFFHVNYAGGTLAAEA